jgi:hypothetical protein
VDQLLEKGIGRQSKRRLDDLGKSLFDRRGKTIISWPSGWMVEKVSAVVVKMICPCATRCSIAAAESTPPQYWINGSARAVPLRLRLAKVVCWLPIATVHQKTFATLRSCASLCLARNRPGHALGDVQPLFVG